MAISAGVGGFAAYLAIRIDISVMKIRLDHAEKTDTRLEVEINAAHDRIDRLRKNGVDTR